jgi:iron complex outermembrane receptor protein
MKNKAKVAGTRRCLSALICCVSAPAAMALNSVESLKQMSIESLMNVEVYTASKHLETTQSTASATYVITREELQRSGVTTVPDALRLVPGAQVGRVDANKWAVSIRGFASRESNKLLVLVDGRSIYDPLFSGTLWESQDFMIEDIERIEVIRGPGGTLWGANAFNGVISIVTRDAGDTQGALVTGGAGTEDRYIAAGRFGWRPGEDQSARVYVKGFERNTGYTDADDAYDEARARRAGFRWDYNPGSGQDTWTVSGDLFQADTGTRESAALVQDVRHQGRNMLARWTRAFSSDRSLQVQAFHDHVEYEGLTYQQSRNTYDLEVQHRWRVAARHQLIVGGGMRSLQDDTATAFPGIVEILPLRRDDQLVNMFVQDTVALLPDRLSLIAGLKYEKTDYADSDWLPSVRLAWTPTPNETVWAAVSEATRVPSRIESDLTFFNVLRLGANYGPEKVRSHELGRRQRLGDAFWYDVVLFHNTFDALRTGEAGGPLGNGMYGNGRGIETALRWQPLETLRFEATYTYTDTDLALRATSTAAPGQVTQTEGLAPRNQASVRASHDIRSGTRLDATLRHVGELHGIAVPSYTELDVVVSFKLPASLELSLAGRNLLHDHHREQAFATSGSGLSSQVQRSAGAQLTWTR